MAETIEFNAFVFFDGRPFAIILRIAAISIVKAPSKGICNEMNINKKWNELIK